MTFSYVIPSDFSTQPSVDPDTSLSSDIYPGSCLFKNLKTARLLMKYNFLANPLVKGSQEWKMPIFISYFKIFTFFFPEKNASNSRILPIRCNLSDHIICQFSVEGNAGSILGWCWRTKCNHKTYPNQRCHRGQKASIQPPQNRLLNPNKISAFEPYPK